VSSGAERAMGSIDLKSRNRAVKLTPIDLGMPSHFESKFIDCFLEDRMGTLWIGSRGGLYRRWPDARVEACLTRLFFEEKENG
jgi:hypothetical protein